jgi:hypothetical protein
MAPAGIAGEIVEMNTTQSDHDGNNGFGGPLSTTPIVAQAVLCNPISADSALVNAAQIAGKIAVCQRTSANFATECLNCFNAGAIAVVGGLRPSSDLGQLPGTRGGAAAGVTIPCIQITAEAGMSLIANATADATSPLYLRISSEECSLELGSYSGGKGSSDVTFPVGVTQAGIYPLRLVWENGGGDANCEWFMQDIVTGTKTLINDPAGTVKAWTSRLFPTGGAHFNPTIVSGVNATLSWTGEGELQYAFSVTGPWYKSANQSNPQTVQMNIPGASPQFFRIRSY